MIAERDVSGRGQHLGAHPDPAATIAVLAVVVAEEQVHSQLAGELLELGGDGGVAIVQPRQRRFRPDHEARTAARGLAGERQVMAEVRPGFLRVPLVLLQDRRLDEADSQPAGLRDRPAQPPHAVGHHRAHQQRGSQERPQPWPAARLDDRIRDRRRRRRHHERHRVHRAEAGNLDHRELRVLAIAEEAPREVEQRVAAQDLHRHPGHRGQQQGAGPPGARPERHHPTEQTWEQGEGETEQGHDGDSHRHRQAAVLDHHQRCPIDDAQRRQRPRQVTQPEAVARAPRPRQGDEQRDQRDPGHEAVAEFRERQGEQDPGRRRQRLRPAECLQEAEAIPPTALPRTGRTSGHATAPAPSRPRHEWRRVPPAR